MQVTVYLDLIFLINYVVDFYVLLITGWLVHQKTQMVRIGLGALFGSLCLLPFTLIPRLLMGVSGVMLSTGISMGAVFIALGKAGGFMRKWFLSTTVMVLFGGIFHFLKGWFGRQQLTCYIWMILFMASGIILVMLIRLLKRNVYRGNQLYRIIISHQGRSVEEYVYMDTGNQLWDTLYNKPVLLLSEELMERLLSKEELYLIGEYKKKGYIDYSNPILLKTQKRMCFHEIAYQSVGKSSGKLLCFLLERMECREKNTCYTRQPTAIADAFLFQGKEYKGLLFPVER